MSETKITIVYDNPTDPEVFEKAYETEQLEAARRIPGHIRFEASKVWPKEDGSPTPAYRMIDLYYPDYDAACAAVTTPEASAFFEAMARLSTGGVRADVRDRGACPLTPSSEFALTAVSQLPHLADQRAPTTHRVPLTR